VSWASGGLKLFHLRRPCQSSRSRGQRIVRNNSAIHHRRDQTVQRETNRREKKVNKRIEPITLCNKVHAMYCWPWHSGQQEVNTWPLVSCGGKGSRTRFQQWYTLSQGPPRLQRRLLWTCKGSSNGEATMQRINPSRLKIEAFAGKLICAGDNANPKTL
jgi:hypothetical protein